MTITQLEYVLALYQTRSFNDAAKRCFVTQPTLSMQIKKLEEHLGVQIFDRAVNPIVPTQIGLKVIEQALVAVEEFKRIKSLIHDQKEAVTGKLRLSIIPTISPYLLPKFISKFNKEFPNINLSVEELETKVIIEKLKKEEIDLAILATPLHEAAITELPLYYEPFLVYLPQESPLLKSKYINLSQVESQDLLLLKEGHCFRSQMEAICRMKKRKDSKLNFSFEAGNLDTLVKLVDQKVGITLLPFLKYAELTREQKQRVRNFKSPTPSREVSIVALKSVSKRKIITSLQTLIQENMKKDILEMNEFKVTVVDPE